VPHISLVFREIWDTTALSLRLLTDPMHLEVNIGDRYGSPVGSRGSHFRAIHPSYIVLPDQKIRKLTLTSISTGTGFP